MGIILIVSPTSVVKNDESNRKSVNPEEIGQVKNIGKVAKA